MDMDQLVDNSYQTQYYKILYKLLNEYDKKINSRIGIVYSKFFETIRVNLNKEFPLMDLKYIKFDNIIHELLWFINGDSNIKYLVDNKCNIWNDDAYRYYKSKDNTGIVLDKTDFIDEIIKGNPDYGSLDRIYGVQWRSFNGKTDQLANAINTLKNNPEDRRIIVTSHNPTDIEDNIVGLPSCHNIFQFYTIPITKKERSIIYYELNNNVNLDTLNEIDDKILDDNNVPKYKLNLWFNLRSNDFFLGQPYNMPSYSLLTHIVAKITNMIPNEVVCSIIDCHLYEKHIDAAKEYINRYESSLDDKYCKSNIIIDNISNIDSITYNKIKLVNYNPLSYIKAPLLT